MPAPVPSPTRPVEWLDDGEAGAEESARYFLELYRYIQATQDTGPWEAISDPECVFCQSTLDTVAASRANKTVTAPGPIVVSSVVTRQLAATSYEVTMDVTLGPDDVLDLDGKVLSTSESDRATLVLFVVRDSTDWRLRGLSDAS